MFPLGTALLPWQPLPLQVFEPRYLLMMRDVAGTDGRFGVVLIERGGEVAGIEQVRPIMHGRYAVIGRGQQRFEVVRWLPDDPYPRAEVRYLPELEWSDEHTQLLHDTEHAVRRALSVMSEYRPQMWAADVELSETPAIRAWQLAGIAPLGPLDQLTLLRSESILDLLERTTELTAEALDLLPLQFPDDPT